MFEFAMIWLRSIACVLFMYCVLPAPAAGQQDACTLSIRGLLSGVPADVIAGMTVSTGLGTPSRCTTGDVPGELCRATVSCDTQDAVLGIAVPNFKRYRRNIPALRFEAGRSSVNLGEISLQRSELPVVVQVVRSMGRSDTVRFQLVLRNSLQREVFVRFVTVTARKAGANVSCLIGGVASFELKDTIRLTPVEGHLLATGSFQETTQGRGFDVPTNGGASVSLCGGATSLTLELPAAFTIPGGQYSSVDFLLPRRLNVKFAAASRPIAGERFERELSDPLAYESYRFMFTTDRDEELEIVGQYRENRFAR